MVMEMIDKTKHINIGKFELILFCNEDWTIRKPVFGTISYNRTISYNNGLAGDNLEWFCCTKIKTQLKNFSIESVPITLSAEEKEDYRRLIKTLRKEVGYERPRTDD